MPAWTLAEFRLSGSQARWLLRAFCSLHALPCRATAQVGTGTVPLVDLVTRLSEQGVLLMAVRVADVRALQPGDVLVLGDHAGASLFGCAAAEGGGLALVIDVGTRVVRLSPAMAPEAIGCGVSELQAAWPGWVMRSRWAAQHPAAGGWGEAVAA